MPSVDLEYWKDCSKSTLQKAMKKKEVKLMTSGGNHGRGAQCEAYREAQRKDRFMFLHRQTLIYFYPEDKLTIEVCFFSSLITSNILT